MESTDNKGWVKLHRSLLEDPIWTKTTSNQRSVLIAILLMANHAGAKDVFGKKCNLEPGEFITSENHLAEASGEGITRRIVRKALSTFQNTYGFLSYEAKQGGCTRIKITNWLKYQGFEWGDSKQEVQVRYKQGTSEVQDGYKQGTTEVQPRYINNNDNNVKNERMKEEKTIGASQSEIPEGAVVIDGVVVTEDMWEDP